MKVVKVPTFFGANFRYELQCPTCGQGELLSISSLIRWAAFIAASGAVVFLQHEVEHGYSLTLGVLDYVSGLTLASIIGSLFIGVVVVLAVLWIIWRPEPTDLPPCSS
jgi:hypothetical protein